MNDELNAEYHPSLQRLASYDWKRRYSIKFACNQAITMVEKRGGLTCVYPHCECELNTKVDPVR